MSLEEVHAAIASTLLQIPGWCVVEKGQRMAEIARGEETCVELGVFGGRGLVSMAMGLRDAGHGRAFGIDPYTASACLEGSNDPANMEWWSTLDYESIAKSAQDLLGHLGLSAYAWLIRSRSADAVRMFHDSSVDVLHQDSNHSMEVSCEEVMLWTPKVKPGGYWIFDDTDWPSTKKAQEVLLGRGYREVEDHEKWKIYQREGP